MKYYVSNGNLHIVVQTDTMDEAAISMAKRILQKCQKADLTTFVSEAGHMDDLIKANMTDAIDNGKIYLTSSIFSMIAEENDNDDANDVESSELYSKYMEAAISLIDKETEVISGDGEMANLIELL